MGKLRKAASANGTSAETLVDLRLGEKAEAPRMWFLKAPSSQSAASLSIPTGEGGRPVEYPRFRISRGLVVTDPCPGLLTMPTGP